VRVLLDECVPRKLRRELPGHDVSTVVEIGWSGTSNGALLLRAAASFDVLLTVDTNLAHQQSAAALPIAVVVLEGPRNDIAALLPLMPQVQELLHRMKPRRLYRITAAPSP
jgi:hypothetical protein